VSGRRRVARFAVCIVCALLTTGSLLAAELTHKVRSGESAASIAKHYYGDHELAQLLLQYNGRSSTLIHVGESLRVPYAAVHTVKSGDAWSVLAQRYLGRPDGWPSVAALNDLPAEAPLRVGTTLFFPVVLDHALRRGESLAALAERYYGDPKKGALLAEFNRIDDPRRLSVGQQVEIPLITPRLRAGARRPSSDSAAATKVAKTVAEPRIAPPEPAAVVAQVPASVPEKKPAPEPPRPRFTAPLAAAKRALEQGEFEKAREGLEALRDAVNAEGLDHERAELWRLLATVYVAFDLPAKTCAAYQALTRIEERPSFDGAATSPKVRQAIAGCDPRPDS